MGEKSSSGQDLRQLKDLPHSVSQSRMSPALSPRISPLARHLSFVDSASVTSFGSSMSNLSTATGVGQHYVDMGDMSRFDGDSLQTPPVWSSERKVSRRSIPKVFGLRRDSSGPLDVATDVEGYSEASEGRKDYTESEDSEGGDFFEELCVSPKKKLSAIEEEEEAARKRSSIMSYRAPASRASPLLGTGRHSCTSTPNPTSSSVCPSPSPSPLRMSASILRVLEADCKVSLSEAEEEEDVMHIGQSLNNGVGVSIPRPPANISGEDASFLQDKPMERRNSYSSFV